MLSEVLMLRTDIGQEKEEILSYKTENSERREIQNWISCVVFGKSIEAKPNK